MTAPSRRTTIIVLAVCLVVSLGLNLFAAGALVAMRWLGSPVGATFSAVMQSYPPALRHEVRRELIAQRQSLRAAADELREARQRMFVLIRADPIDQEALAGSMAEVRVKTTALQALLQSVLAASLENISPSERRKIEPPPLGLGFFRDNRP